MTKHQTIAAVGYLDLHGWVHYTCRRYMRIVHWQNGEQNGTYLTLHFRQAAGMQQYVHAYLQVEP